MLFRTNYLFHQGKYLSIQMIFFAEVNLCIFVCSAGRYQVKNSVFNISQKANDGIEPPMAHRGLEGPGAWSHLHKLFESNNLQ